MYTMWNIADNYIKSLNQLNSLKTNIMLENESLIGKYYIPSDNSWSVNVTDCGNILSHAQKAYLAGTIIPYNKAKKCIIVSEPFMCNTQTAGIKSTNNTNKMIMVEYQNETHMVLFQERNIK